MRHVEKPFHWLYLIQAEDSMTPVYSRFASTCKICMWLGVSILIGAAMAQLS